MTLSGKTGPGKMGPDTLSEQIAEFFVANSYDTLPADVIVASKRMVADTLACAWAGTGAPGIDKLTRYFMDEGGRTDATVWGFGGRLPGAPTAFLNGVSAAALDYDSLHLGGLAHSPIVILPAVLAVAERRHASGKEVLAALALGVELHCRLGMATKDHSGWFFTSMHGVFAAAAASAKFSGSIGTGYATPSASRWRSAAAPSRRPSSKA